MPHDDIRKKLSDLARVAVEGAANEMGGIRSKVGRYMDQNKPLLTTGKHKILMLGGQRSGKSTILSSILHSMKDATNGVCVVEDITDYQQELDKAYGSGHGMSSLAEKKKELEIYVKKSDPNSIFLVDSSPNERMARYTLKVSANDTSIELTFIDVPGEWMRENSLDYEELIMQVREADVFLVAIDTPYLMQENGEFAARKYNRIDEITNILSEIKIASAVDKKLILLCPTKCEKWTNKGEAHIVTKVVKKSYGQLIRRWEQYPEVHLMIMPINTIGGIEFFKMYPAMRAFLNEQDLYGTPCCVDFESGNVTTHNGRIAPLTSFQRVEKDKAKEIDHFTMPNAWYRSNGKGYCPKYTEQPGLHILQFMVKKEDGIAKYKAERNRMRVSGFPDFVMTFIRFFEPTFGTYLPIWKGLIEGFENSKCINDNLFGFEKILPR